jgi:hypothetical protein
LCVTQELEAARRSDSNQQADNKQNKRQAEQTPRSLAIRDRLTAPMKKPGLAARAFSFVCWLCVPVVCVGRSALVAGRPVGHALEDIVGRLQLAASAVAQGILQDEGLAALSAVA